MSEPVRDPLSGDGAPPQLDDSRTAQRRNHARGEPDRGDLHGEHDGETGSGGQPGGAGTGRGAGAGGGRSAAADSTVARATATIAELAQRWRRRTRMAATTRGAAVALPLAAVALRFAPLALRLPLAIAALVLPPLIAWLISRRRPADPVAMAAHLDRRLPALGESAALLLPSAVLPPLQRLQQRRTAVALLQQDDKQLAATLPWQPLWRAGAALGAGLALALLMAFVPTPRSPGGVTAARNRAASFRVTPPTPLLRGVALAVQPPAYTGRERRTVRGLAAIVEEGSQLRWRVETAPAVTSAALLFDETERAPLRHSRSGAFELAATARAPRLVRLLLDGDGRELWRSAPVRLEVLADRPPTLELLAPASTLVERPPDRPGSLPLEISLADDYAVASAELVITLVKGSDEQVTFAEQRLPLPVRRVPARQVIRQSLDLAALGLTAESELYLRVEARDGRRPDPALPPQPNLVRSPTVVVRPLLPRQESAPLGEGLPLIAGPELFRSQRQIVIDTQKLVADSPRLAAAEVMRRSQVIAFDQRALRLRYGTLLGQEFEEGRPAGEEEEPQRPLEGIGGPALGGIGDISDELKHEHDSALNATFLPPPVRTKLRAMLASMWDAEGALALGTPRAALPHELRALELLKQVQQADRVYVRRTAGELAPLDLARRLTGELEGVRSLDEREPPPQPKPVVDEALVALTLLGGRDGAGEVRDLDRMLAAAGAWPAGPKTGALMLPASTVATLAPALADRARAGSAAALAALPALDALAAGRPLPTALRNALERALWELVPPPQAPVRREAPAGALWGRYRASLGEIQ